MFVKRCSSLALKIILSTLVEISFRQKFRLFCMLYQGKKYIRLNMWLRVIWSVTSFVISQKHIINSQNVLCVIDSKFQSPNIWACNEYVCPIDTSWTPYPKISYWLISFHPLKLKYQALRYFFIFCRSIEIRLIMKMVKGQIRDKKNDFVYISSCFFFFNVNLLHLCYRWGFFVIFVMCCQICKPVRVNCVNCEIYWKRFRVYPFQWIHH